MARQNRDDPHSLEEQLAWLDAIKENEDAPTGLDTPSDEPVSPYPKDPWLAVPADPPPVPSPMFRAAADAGYSPSSVAVADDPGAADTATIDDPFATRPVKDDRPGAADDPASGPASPLSRSAGSAADRPATDSSGDEERSSDFGRSGPLFGDLGRGPSGTGISGDTPGRGIAAPDGSGESHDGPAARSTDPTGPAAGTGRGDKAPGADRPAGIPGLGSFAVGGSADATPPGSSGGDDSRPDPLPRRDKAPLPKRDKSDPLGLGAFGDRGRDGDTRTGGLLGAFGDKARTSFAASPGTGSSGSDSDTAEEPVRGWLEPAVPASAAGTSPASQPSPADEDDEEQRRFEAFMAGGDLRDRDDAPRRDRGTFQPEEDPADPPRASRLSGPLPGPDPTPRDPRGPILDPLSDPRLSAAASATSAASAPSAPSASTQTDPQPRSPLDSPQQPPASGRDTGPQAPPHGDTGPQVPPATADLGRIASAMAGAGPHAPPRVDPAAAPPAPEPAVEGTGPERRAQRSHRRPIPQQAFSRPPRPPADPAKPTADSLDPQTLLKGRRNAPTSGWRRLVYKASGGWIKPGEPAEVRRRRELVGRARTPVANGHHRVAVLSLKGGVGKTTTTVGLGATLAQVRGDRVIAVDANPDRGTLSDKVVLETSATVRDLLNERDQIQRYADIRAFTSQAPSRLEILASDRDPSISEAFSAEDYQIIAQILENYYSICITDCGTGLLHSAMAGVLGMADQIVLVSSPSVDGARAASATLDWLEAHNYGDLVKAASVVLCSVRPRSKSTIDLDRLEAHFAARCRSVVRVPYDPHLEEGAEIDLDLLQPATLDAYLQLAAAVGDGFAGPRH